MHHPSSTHVLLVKKFWFKLFSRLLFFTQFALSKLIRGNELELAVSMGMVISDNSHMYHQAVEYLARKCERLGKWWGLSVKCFSKNVFSWLRWQQHCIFPALTTGYFIVFPRFLLARLIYIFPAPVICYVYTRPLISLCRPLHAFPASLSSSIFHAHIIGYFTIFPALALPLSLLFYFPALVCMCVPALLFRFSLLCYIELVVMLSVWKLAQC